MTDTAAAALASLTAQYEANAAELDAAAIDASGFILAWPTGLGVRWVQGEPKVCGVLHADRITDGDMVQTITNGAGETARLTSRKEALEAAARSTRECIAFLTETVAAKAA